MSERKYRWIGTRAIRPDGLEKVTGRANYGADLSLPGTLHGAFLRSPHAHARIVSIDTRRAEKLPGVKAVVTARDFPELPRDMMGGVEGMMNLRDVQHNCLARDKVLYHGHAIAAVAATTLEIARAGAGLIEVTYEVLEPVLEIERAIAGNAPILDQALRTAMMRGDLPDGPTNIASRLELSRGDLAKGFAGADVVIEREFRTPMIHQGYIEPHACTARVGEDGQVTIWCCTQGSFLVRDLVALVLGIDAAKVKVVPSEIGGGFGGKTTVYLEPVAAVLARKARRPVKMVMTREEVFRTTGNSGSLVKAKLGATRDGKLVAADVSIWMEAGAFPGSPASSAAICGLALYRIPNYRIEAHDVVLNKPKAGAYRAPGAPMSAFAVESVLDELARALDIDPIELRLRNAVEAGDRTPTGSTLGSFGFRETLEAARNHPHYRAPLGPNQGRGVASGYWMNGGMQSSANVMLQPDGTAVVATGNPDIGGTRAAMALIVAEELGLPYERVRSVVLDTDSVGFTDLTGGSRTAAVTGHAVQLAARQVVDQLRERAAGIWGIAPDEVRWEDGRAIATNGASDLAPLSIDELAAKAGHTGGPINGRGSLYGVAAPAAGTHICDVEVDPETGVPRVLRYTVVQDAGKAIHPSYVEGQMQGGAVQGIGWALNEEYIYDAKGVMQNPGFLDYRMPVASDLPMIDTVIVEVPNPRNPYGARGVGELPIVPPLATVANAVSNATGVRFTELPLSPPRILERLESRSGR
jgi:CO/xanthine dehydrogenase Mo-binding subunit